MNLIYVPIEPLAERYTESWYREFPKEFTSLGWNVTVVDGEPLTNEVEVGTFLDINSTVHYKNSQMQKIAKMFHNKEIADGTHFFIGDLEFWGIESLRLMAQMNEIGIKIHGYLHAASFTIGDAFSVADDYQRYTELGWIASVNTVFVGSQYQKDTIVDRRLDLIECKGTKNNLADRIKVVGNPLFLDDYKPYSGEKLNQIVLPNRFDKEKNPKESLDAAIYLSNTFDCKVVITTGRSTFRGNCDSLISYAKYATLNNSNIEIKAGLTKDQYHEELAKSKYMISHSPEESFGYCIVEAMLYSCIPLCFRAASHPELLVDVPWCLFDEDLNLYGKFKHLQDLDENGLSKAMLKPSVVNRYNSTSVLSNISLYMLKS